MPKRALDEDDCIVGDSNEADSLLATSVIIGSSSSSELDALHVSMKDDADDDDDDDVDRQSECSAVMESSASDEASLQTDGSTDAAEPCPTSTLHLLSYFPPVCYCCRHHVMFDVREASGFSKHIVSLCNLFTVCYNA